MQEENKTENNLFDSTSNENFVNNDKIYILGAFDESISQKVIPDFIELVGKKKNSKNAEIEIYINSHGGDADMLLSMLSVIAMAKSEGIKITTYNLGVANSCGSILFIHGDNRKMFKYATNVMHLGWVSRSWTTYEQLDRVTDSSKKWFNTIVDWYAKNTKMKKADIIRILKDDQFCLDANQCLKYGFCDEII
jgi:ATP-dependent Clp protease, protease subunit